MSLSPLRQGQGPLEKARQWSKAERGGEPNVSDSECYGQRHALPSFRLIDLVIFYNIIIAFVFIRVAIKFHVFSKSAH